MYSGCLLARNVMFLFVRFIGCTFLLSSRSFIVLVLNFIRALGSLRCFGNVVRVLFARFVLVCIFATYLGKVLFVGPDHVVVCLLLLTGLDLV